MTTTMTTAELLDHLHELAGLAIGQAMELADTVALARCAADELAANERVTP